MANHLPRGAIVLAPVRMKGVAAKPHLTHLLVTDLDALDVLPTVNFAADLETR